MSDQVRTSYSISSVAMVSKAIGGVAPLGWITSPANVVIDKVLSEYEVVWAAAGHPHAVFPTSFNQLRSITNASEMVVGD
jgi:prolyl-tRNA editing enzyme YbaK/EbsC (Cys-tRNA(Pro) deacylase)